MKRITCLFLVLLILPVCSFAEQTQSTEFSIRNGISFGMTKDEISKIETLPIKSDFSPIFTNYGPATIFGIASSNAEYDFDENGELYQMYFALGDEETKSTTKANYDKIVDSLTQKYGEPLDMPDGETYEYVTSALGLILPKNQASWKKNNIPHEYAYREWALQYDIGLVKIECVYFYTQVNGARLILEYALFDNNADSSILDEI